MSRTKKFITAGTTFSLALGIGFVMQYGDAVAARWGADRPVAGPASQTTPLPEIIPVSASIAVPTTMSLPAASAQPDVTPVAVTDIPTEVETPIFDMVAEPEPVAAEPAPVVETPEEDIVAEADACNVSLVATPAELAMVTLTLDSPCHYQMVATIHHEGMMFHGIMDDEGQLSVDVPALREEAFFIVTFDDGAGAAALTGVPEVAMYDRAVLQWQGTEDVQLHALEFGATYGEDGHIWAASMADTAVATTGDGGFLTRLGHEMIPGARMAEIYTFPSGMTARTGDVVLNVEAEVTERNCGRSIAAQSIQISPSEEASIMDLTLTMPDCDAIGEYLVLKNMFEDLTLAAK